MLTGAKRALAYEPGEIKNRASPPISNHATIATLTMSATVHSRCVMTPPYCRPPATATGGRSQAMSPPRADRQRPEGLRSDTHRFEPEEMLDHGDHVVVPRWPGCQVPSDTHAARLPGTAGEA